MEILHFLSTNSCFSDTVPSLHSIVKIHRLIDESHYNSLGLITLQLKRCSRFHTGHIVIPLCLAKLDIKCVYFFVMFKGFFCWISYVKKAIYFCLSKKKMTEHAVHRQVCKYFVRSVSFFFYSFWKKKQKTKFCRVF